MNNEIPKFNMSPDPVNGGNNLENKENKITPQKMLEEIRSAYPSSHAFLQEILNAGKDNWGV